MARCGSRMMQEQGITRQVVEGRARAREGFQQQEEPQPEAGPSVTSATEGRPEEVEVG